MLMTWEVNIKRRNIASDDAWSDTDSSISDSAPSAPKLDPSTITVLDRPHDVGSHLTKLSLCMDFETQWVSFDLETKPSLIVIGSI